MNGSKVSVVDDDPSAREGITDLVKSMGFDVRAFERAEDFLKSAHLDRCDCLITDMRMPGMSGLELYDRLLASGLSIPTIMVTAFPKDADRARAQRVGIVCYLSKPFDESQIAECILSALGSDTGDSEKS